MIKATQGGTPMISFKGVNKWYGEYHALNDINATVNKGEVIVVCGPSGSGKSTLIRTVNRLEPIQKGSIEFDGQDVYSPKLDINKFRAHVGFVFQSFNLFPHLSVTENIELAPVTALGETAARHVHARCNCSNAWDWRTRRRPIRGNSPAANSSAWRLRARWR